MASTQGFPRVGPPLRVPASGPRIALQSSTPRAAFTTMALTISSDQVDEMGWRSFENRLAQMIHETDPESRDFIQTSEGGAFLEEACAAAAEHGMEGELATARYVLTAWLLGSDFDTRFPAMAEILVSAMPPSLKAEALEKVTIALLDELETGQQ